MRSRPSVRDALLLGVVQGPTELLPVSSSAHVALLTSALGARGPAADAERYDALEVALHAGAAIALLVAGCGELERVWREVSGRRLRAGVLAAAVPALAGLLLERAPAARLSGPRTIAAGLALGGAAMALADCAPQERTLAQVGPRDGLALGVAQALALVPGVSRNGATLTAARARGFERAAARTLSWRVGLPVLFGAASLRALRGRGREISREERRMLAAGAGAAFASTLASARVLRGGERARGLLPFALYRIVLGLLVARAQ